MGIRTIMVVDTDNTVHDLVKAAVSEQDTRIVSMDNSRDALTYLETNPAIDLLLIQSTLPVSKESVLVPIKPEERYQTLPSETVLRKPFTVADIQFFLQQHR
jgi:CheY-like chemotaxis protein